MDSRPEPKMNSQTSALEMIGGPAGAVYALSVEQFEYAKNLTPAAQSDYLRNLARKLAPEERRRSLLDVRSDEPEDTAAGERPETLTVRVPNSNGWEPQESRNRPGRVIGAGGMVPGRFKSRRR